MAHEKSDIIVSVVIPVYNAEEYIADTLKNIVSQSLYEFEIKSFHNSDLFSHTFERPGRC